MTVANAQAPVRFASPPKRFEVRVQPRREAVSVRPTGELDLLGSRTLTAALDEIVEAGFEDIVIDLRAVTFIDCAGVRVLLAQHAAAVRDGRRQSLVHARDCIRRVFALTDTLDLLPFDRRQA
jgi:anti-sigma B factor antagonist